MTGNVYWKIERRMRTGKRCSKGDVADNQFQFRGGTKPTWPSFSNTTLIGSLNKTRKTSLVESVL